MDFEIKKDLTSNWFKTLQDSICHSISELEKNKIKFKSKTWKRNQNKDEGGGEYRMHFNTRYICTSLDWFGGGMDITPSKKDENEKKEFHRILKKMCNRYNKKYYPKYKKWCDEYFYLPHRKEARGIGGIFFDYKMNNFEKDFKFVRDVGTTFELIFKKIIKKKFKKKWTLRDKEMQYIKRGRYTEFNLLYDRGTKFGLQTGGNVEGILMSLPPIAKWK